MPASDGPPVLLLHGFATSFATTWSGNGWTDLLADAGRTVIGVDMLGHGEADKPTDPEAYRNLEDLVAEHLPGEPVDAVGFSTGARVLLVLAARDPQRFRRLVLAGVGRNLFEQDSARGLEIVEAVRTGAADDPELTYFARLPESPGADRAALVAFLQRPDPQPITSALLANVNVPVHVVIGDQDGFGPADPLIEALPNATLTTLRGVDHFATPKNFGFIDTALDFLGAQPY